MSNVTYTSDLPPLLDSQGRTHTGSRVAVGSCSHIMAYWAELTAYKLYLGDRSRNTNFVILRKLNKS